LREGGRGELFGQNKYEIIPGMRIGRSRPGQAAGLGRRDRRGSTGAFVLVESLAREEERVKPCTIANYPCKVANEAINLLRFFSFIEGKAI
jgi:hypothetical protein